jgi:hypothetical protein
MDAFRVDVFGDLENPVKLIVERRLAIPRSRQRSSK